MDDEEARRKKERAPLDEEVARRWDPERLGRAVAAAAGKGERLDLPTRGQMERLLPGHDFSRVRVFRGPLAEEVTRRHGADAVTLSQTGMVLVRQGSRSSPGTTSGRALLAHEMAHVAQGQRGMKFALAQEAGEGEHEREAEQVESQVLRGAPSATDEAALAGRQRAKRKKVVERVLELMADDERLRRERNGDDH